MKLLRPARVACEQWHVGHTAGHLPTDHGFDHFLGLPYSQDIGYTTGNTTAGHACDLRECGNASWGCFPVPLMRDGAVVQQPVQLESLTSHYLSESLRFLRAAVDKPWLL